MSVLALIPARGGSKGIPGKNLISVGNKPLIAWTIEAARASNVVDRVLVSTDSGKIAEVARENGAEAPWLRPAELAADDTPALAVARHALNAIERAGARFEWLFLLQPTSPLRAPEDIRGALNLAQARDCDSVVGVVQSHVHPAWLFTLDTANALTPFGSQAASAQRQERQSLYAPNGAIYLIKTDILRDGGSWYGPKMLGYVMPEERSLDIDTPWDLHLARLILEDRKNG